VEWHGPTAKRKPGNQEFCIQQNCSSKVRGNKEDKLVEFIVSKTCLKYSRNTFMLNGNDSRRYQGRKGRRKKRALEMVKAQVNITESINVFSHIFSISIGDMGLHKTVSIKMLSRDV